MRKQSKFSLLVGFGGLLLLMGGLGVSAISFLDQIELRHERIRTSFVDRNRILEKLRSDLYLLGTHVRDFLLDGGGVAAAQHRAAYLKTQRRIESGMSQYQRSLRPEEVEPFEALQHGLGSYFETLAPVFGWSPPELREKAPAFVEAKVLPQRASMLSMADDVERVNEKLMEVSTREAIELFSGFRMKLLLLVLLTIVIGIVLAGTSMWRILQLEKESEARFSEIVKARSELKNLSARVLAVQEEERRRISRELHDEVGQSLWAMTLGIGNLQGALDGGDQAEAVRQLSLVREIADSSVQVVRNMSLLLRPSMLDDLGLLPALNWLAREVSRTTELRVDITADALPEDLPEEHKTCVYRIVQEALRNSSRHANARSARIFLRASATHLQLYVQDDGVGFDPERDKGLGLLGIEERVSHIGGAVQVNSAPGRGTTIGLQLPLAFKFATAS